MPDFPLKLSIRLDWSEMDIFGHINNVAYFKFIQASRVNYWEATDLVHTFREQNAGPILLSATCHFIKPLFYPGNIIVEARMEFIKNTSFGIHHRIINSNNELCAEAHDVIVCYDFNKKEKIPVTDSFRIAVASIEKQ